MLVLAGLTPVADEVAERLHRDMPGLRELRYEVHCQADG